VEGRGGGSFVIELELTLKLIVSVLFMKKKEDQHCRDEKISRRAYWTDSESFLLTGLGP
jgi:hypothetical protein